MVFAETETGMQLYHKPEKGEIKNPLIAGLVIVQAVKLCYVFTKFVAQFFLPLLVLLPRCYTVFLKILRNRQKIAISLMRQTSAKLYGRCIGSLANNINGLLPLL